jgi:hypothetical protein
MDALGDGDVVSDQLDQRHQHGGARSYPIRQGRGVELDPFAGIAGALPVQRLVLAELGIEDHRQEARPGTSPRDRVEGCWRLGDRLATAAGELLPHGLDHLPLPRHYLQRLGNILAELSKPATTARAGARCGDYHALARQIGRQRRAYRLPASEADDRGSVDRDDGRVVLGGVRLQLLELQLHLVKQVLRALR